MVNNGIETRVNPCNYSPLIPLINLNKLPYLTKDIVLPTKSIDYGLVSEIYTSVFKAIRAGQRAVKGTRAKHIPVVLQLGLNQGLRLFELLPTLDCKYFCGYQTLKRASNNGLIYKDSQKRYYLTDKGQLVFNTVMSVMSESLEELIKYVRERAMEK